jgi:PTS system nitrogen regulatory IIA component
MTIGELIGADHVIVGLRVVDKTQLLQELARRASAELSLDQRAIFGALQGRENLGSTGLGKGFALPHARLSELPHSFALFVRLTRPIDFAAIDRLPVDLVILLLTSATAGNQHLATLAALSRPLRSGAFMQRLRHAPDAATVHELLTNPDL